MSNVIKMSKRTLDLIKTINALRKMSVKEIINKRIRTFKNFDRKNKEKIFSELCFCILTANYTAEGGIRIQNALKNKFLTLSQEELEEKLRELKHRFPRKRAEFIVEAREKLNSLMSIINSNSGEQEIREWLVKNIKGLGYKEASHFLRNIGFKDIAIIDYHIIDILVRYGIIKKPKTKSLTRKRYLEIERVLRELSEKTGLALGELDLYLWFLETGRVLK